MPREEAYRKSLKNLIDARLVTKNGKAKKRICTRWLFWNVFQIAEFGFGFSWLFKRNIWTCYREKTRACKKRKQSSAVWFRAWNIFWRRQRLSAILLLWKNAYSNLHHESELHKRLFFANSNKQKVLPSIIKNTNANADGKSAAPPANSKKSANAKSVLHPFYRRLYGCRCLRTLSFVYNECLIILQQIL